MQKIYIILITLFLGSLFMTACETDELMFKTDERYIYLDIPFKLDKYGATTTVREDSLLHSFAFDAPDMNEYTFKLPVAVAGMPVPDDCVYAIEVVPELTNLTDDDWDKSIIERPVIHKNLIFDTLYVKVKKPGDNTGLKQITFRLLANEHFGLSDSTLLTVRLCYTRELSSPAWWATWEYYMGTFCPEVYLKWRELYYEGADPSGYYWDNMPTSTIASWYPVTFMYLTQLKLYFEEHETYPYGDRTKPRIRINL